MENTRQQNTRWSFQAFVEVITYEVSVKLLKAYLHPQKDLTTP